MRFFVNPIGDRKDWPYPLGLFFLVLLLLSCSGKKPVPPGIPLDLAIERKQSISNLAYDLHFNLPASAKDSIPATEIVSFQLKNNDGPILLDFNAPAGQVKSVRVNHQDEAVIHENEHLVIGRKSLTAGANTIEIEFIAGDAALNRNADYLYTLFVPSRASSCFPAFDQPDLKAVYRLQLSIPKNWVAVSNGRIMSIDSSGSQIVYRFLDTKPTSTYQFAFAAGKLSKATDPVSGMNIYYRETDTAKVTRNLPKIFELHRTSLAWLKDYTGIDYPYEKFDFVLMPAFQFGGMEHPGSIFYRESSLFLDPSASVLEEMRRASLIAHETAHMWFGNLVTMKWFNDVWLKEVFANFMAAKMVNPSFPQINHELRFLMAHYPAAYDIDRSAGSHPVQQPLDNLRNAGSIYGAIIYQKAPIMMRNLESLMGAGAFQQGLRDYLQHYSYSNATWDDLLSSLKKHSDKDLEVWNTAWIKTKGMPEIACRAGENKIEVAVVNDSLGITWPQFFLVQVVENGKERVSEITISKDKPSLLEANTLSPMLIPNFKGRGYGYFRADQASMTFMLNTASAWNDPEARAGIWMNVWEYLLHGELDPERVMHKMIDAVNTEKDPLVLEYVIEKIGRIFWQFITPAQRTLLSQSLDDTLFGRMVSEKDNSIKRTLFNGYLNMALSPEGISNLRRFWKNEITAGLDLSERDHIQLAYELALREAEGYEVILQDQLKSITNPDRKAEMEFILPALSSDDSVRDDFFGSLNKKENRGHEPWVLQAQGMLHHPLKAQQAVKYVKPSLDLLEEMQRTGDIFFPKGWLDATLQEYQTPEAAGAVREYLRKNKTLRPDLRNKLLQSSDMLFRAESILKKNAAASK